MASRSTQSITRCNAVRAKWESLLAVASLMAAVHARMLMGAVVPIAEVTVEAGSLLKPNACLSKSIQQHLRAAKCNERRSRMMFDGIFFMLV